MTFKFVPRAEKGIRLSQAPNRPVAQTSCPLERPARSAEAPRQSFPARFGQPNQLGIGTLRALGNQAVGELLGSSFPRKTVQETQDHYQRRDPSPAGLGEESPRSIVDPEAKRRANNPTGLPDELKAGIEGLSGIGMDDVRVRYNSQQPSRFQALAYTKGTEIHVGPGQEQHLPHEAWHVVQQKQGRVRPNLMLKKRPANDQPHLEREAEIMGRKALQATPTDLVTTPVDPEASSPREQRAESKERSRPRIAQASLPPGQATIQCYRWVYQNEDWHLVGGRARPTGRYLPSKPDHKGTEGEVFDDDVSPPSYSRTSESMEHKEEARPPKEQKVKELPKRIEEKREREPPPDWSKLTSKALEDELHKRFKPSGSPPVRNIRLEALPSELQAEIRWIQSNITELESALTNLPREEEKPKEEKTPKQGAKRPKAKKSGVKKGPKKGEKLEKDDEVEQLEERQQLAERFRTRIKTGARSWHDDLKEKVPRSSVNPGSARARFFRDWRAEAAEQGADVTAKQQKNRDRSGAEGSARPLREYTAVGWKEAGQSGRLIYDPEADILYLTVRHYDDPEYFRIEAPRREVEAEHLEQGGEYPELTDHDLDFLIFDAWVELAFDLEGHAKAIIAKQYAAQEKPVSEQASPLLEQLFALRGLYDAAYRRAEVKQKKFDASKATPPAKLMPSSGGSGKKKAVTPEKAESKKEESEKKILCFDQFTWLGQEFLVQAESQYIGHKAQRDWPAYKGGTTILDVATGFQKLLELQSVSKAGIALDDVCLILAALVAEPHRHGPAIVEALFAVTPGASPFASSTQAFGVALPMSQGGTIASGGVPIDVLLTEARVGKTVIADILKNADLATEYAARQWLRQYARGKPRATMVAMLKQWLFSRFRDADARHAVDEEAERLVKTEPLVESPQQPSESANVSSLIERPVQPLEQNPPIPTTETKASEPIVTLPLPSPSTEKGDEPTTSVPSGLAASSGQNIASPLTDVPSMTGQTPVTIPSEKSGGKEVVADKPPILPFPPEQQAQSTRGNIVIPQPSKGVAPTGRKPAKGGAQVNKGKAKGGTTQTKPLKEGITRQQSGPPDNVLGRRVPAAVVVVILAAVLAALARFAG